jgi:hypothetical protein
MAIYASKRGVYPQKCEKNHGVPRWNTVIYSRVNQGHDVVVMALMARELPHHSELVSFVGFVGEQRERPVFDVAFFIK